MMIRMVRLENQVWTDFQNPTLCYTVDTSNEPSEIVRMGGYDGVTSWAQSLACL